ncbi:MAG: HEAT repeat domain-containing protein [Planctomycetes bacterium]|nr:HEAT repeat domain-containing protein [Planctomycetota bacterium]
MQRSMFPILSLVLALAAPCGAEERNSSSTERVAASDALGYVGATQDAAPSALKGLAYSSDDAVARARFAWTGTTIGSKGERIGRAPIVSETTTVRGSGTGPGLAQVPSRANPRATADALLEELAAVKLSIEVDRKLDEAQAKLDELAVRAAWKEDYVARWDVLQEVALARSSLFEKRGKKDAALAALERLLPDAGVKAALGARYEFELADEALVAEETKAIAAPAVARARARLAPSASTARSTEPQAGRDQESSIEASIRAWVSAGDVLALRELGARAVPVLEKVVRESFDSMQANALRDALTLLFQFDEARGAEFALAHFDAGGFLWKKRILRSLEAGGVLRDENTWMAGSDNKQKPTLIDAAWVPLVERLVRDPEVAADTLRGPVRVLCLQDALTPALQAALGAALASEKPGDVQAAFEALQTAYGRSSALGLLERAVASPNATVRRYAAQILLDEERSPALLARASDPDAEVRRIVIQSLRNRQARVAMFVPEANPVNAYRELRPVLGTQERAALRALIEDENASVRRDAIELALGIKPPLDADAYVAIARDPDPELRARLARSLPQALGEAPAILARLAADEVPSVRSALDQSLNRWMKARGDAVLPVFFARIEAPGAPDLENNGNPVLSDCVEHAMQRPSAIVRLLTLATTKEREWLLPHVLRSYPWSLTNLATLQAVDDATFAAFVRVARRVQPSWMPSFAEGAYGMAREGHVLRTAWYETLEDATASRGLRLRAASILALDADARCEDGLRKVLQLDSWTTQALDSDEQNALSDLGKYFRSERRTDYFRGLLQDARVHSVPLVWMIGNAEKDGLAMAILDRWLDAPEANGRLSLLSEAIAALPTSEDAKTVAILKRCLRLERVEVSVLATLGRMKAPFGLELLSDALDARWITDRDARDRVQRDAAAALTGYMSEDAARRLLAGVTLAVSDTARKACLDGLEQIRTYLDEKQRWDLRDSELEQRASAVKELLPLLADPDATVRAQAAKSLATLDAAEHLPKLIALLKDKAPEVRAAAQLAIDQLNAKSAKKE